MRKLLLVVLVSGFSGFGAHAKAPDSSVLPMARPHAKQQETRPKFAVFLKEGTGVLRSVRPLARPAGLAAGAAVVPVQRRVPEFTAQRAKGGGLCGNRQLSGEIMPRISGIRSGCGIKKPVRVHSVGGITLNQPAVLNCTTANALAEWVENGAKPSVGKYGGGIASMRVVSHYSCRTRNSQKGAKLSEHAKGNAIDIASLKLKNGNTLSVLKDWRRRKEGRILKKMHLTACGVFGTVLGPNANKYHQDHFHFDTARYRSGAYCR